MQAQSSGDGGYQSSNDDATSIIFGNHFHMSKDEFQWMYKTWIKDAIDEKEIS